MSYDGPHRRLRMNLDLEADTLDDLIRALTSIATDLEVVARDEREVTSGGYDSGWHYSLTCDPDMHGDLYRDLLSQWREARRAGYTKESP